VLQIASPLLRATLKVQSKKTDSCNTKENEFVSNNKCCKTTISNLTFAAVALNLD